VGEGIDDGMTEKAEMLFPYFNVLTPFFFPPLYFTLLKANVLAS